ncbi:MAG: right-handed parallel beta-helix repeat-containing protein [Sedimentisphaerales bacterium]|nr:right-handed parallel beta-helix repeat-containing protein [Sedimentisphaerales bacterium]
MKTNHNEKPDRLKPHYINLMFLFIILCSLPAMAQPSGGPYGPIRQTYELPKDAGKIYYVAPDGNATQSGEKLEQPTTLEEAIKRVVTGDAIVMRGGTYRTGGLQLNQGITIQPYRDEQPVLKGTLVAEKWERQRNKLWKTSWARLFPEKPADWWRRERNPGTPLHRFNNDMVFADGLFLQSAGSEADVNEGTYFIDYDAKTVFIGADPTKRLVEITAFNDALTRITGKCHGKVSDRKGPVIRGIIFTQYAYRALDVQGREPQGLSNESKYGKDVVGTILENCTISFCSRVAAYLKGDKLTMRNCLISDTSTEGIYVIASADVLLEKNIFRRNNIENITGYFPAAVKIFNQSYRVTCRDNLVTDLPNSNGIWYDVGNVDGRIINNWFEGVGRIDTRFSSERFWPSENAFFFEISKGAICAGNVFVNCDHGLLVLNSSDVQIYNNTFVNSSACIGRTNRSAVGDHFGWHPSTGPDVNDRHGHVFVNNLLTVDENFRRPLLAFSQMSVLCEQLTTPQVKKLDYNVYVRRSHAGAGPLIYWSPAKNERCQKALDSPEDLHKLYPEFSANSRYFDAYNGPLFKCAELGNYEVLEAFTGSKTATKLPPEISKLLAPLKADELFNGAYPVIP